VTDDREGIRKEKITVKNFSRERVKGTLVISPADSAYLSETDVSKYV
jgi:hypothetical protein